MSIKPPKQSLWKSIANRKSKKASTFPAVKQKEKVSIFPISKTRKLLKPLAKTAPAGRSNVNKKENYNGKFRTLLRYRHSTRSDPNIASKHILRVPPAVLTPRKLEAKDIARKNELTEQACFWGEITKSDCVLLLKKQGDYLIRAKEAPDYPISIVCSVFWNNSVRHFFMAQDPFAGYSLGGEVIPSVKKVLEVHKEKPVVAELMCDVRLKECFLKSISFPKLLTPINRPDVLLKKPQISNAISQSVPIKTYDHFVARGWIRDVRSISALPKTVDKVEIISKGWKIPKSKLSNEELRRFVSYIRVMVSIRHPNINKLYGICIEEQLEQLQICSEWMTEGSLKPFLVSRTLAQLSARQLLKYCIDVAAAMDFLEHARQTHGRLSAANLMVFDGGKSVKITDYGDLLDHLTTLSTGNHTVYPKYMAPEKFKRILISMEIAKTSKSPTSPPVFERSGNIKSDVWSFGVTIWEILSLGKNPYEQHTHEGVIHFILQGYRMDPCADLADSRFKKLAKLMLSCWEIDPEKRPNFEEIQKELTTFYDKLP